MAFFSGTIMPLKKYALYNTIEDFTFSMPGGWDDYTISVFLEACHKYVDDLRNHAGDFMRQWSRIVSYGQTMTSNINCFNITVTMELAKVLKAYLLKNENNEEYINNEAFSDLFHDTKELLAYFPSAHESQIPALHQKRCDCIDENKPVPVGDVIKLVSKQYKHLFGVKGIPTSILWSEMNQKVSEKTGLKVDVRQFLEPVKIEIALEVRKETNNDIRIKKFLTLARDYLAYFDYIPPRNIKKSEFLPPDMLDVVIENTSEENRCINSGTTYDSTNQIMYNNADEYIEEECMEIDDVGANCEVPYCENTNSNYSNEEILDQISPTTGDELIYEGVSIEGFEGNYSSQVVLSNSGTNTRNEPKNYEDIPHYESECSLTIEQSKDDFINTFTKSIEPMNDSDTFTQSTSDEIIEANSCTNEKEAPVLPPNTNDCVLLEECSDSYEAINDENAFCSPIIKSPSAFEYSSPQNMDNFLEEGNDRNICEEIQGSLEDFAERNEECSLLSNDSIIVEPILTGSLESLDIMNSRYHCDNSDLKIPENNELENKTSDVLNDIVTEMENDFLGSEPNTNCNITGNELHQNSASSSTSYETDQGEINKTEINVNLCPVNTCTPTEDGIEKFTETVPVPSNLEKLVTSNSEFEEVIGTKPVNLTPEVEEESSSNSHLGEISEQSENHNTLEVFYINDSNLNNDEEQSLEDWTESLMSFIFNDPWCSSPLVLTEEMKKTLLDEFKSGLSNQDDDIFARRTFSKERSDSKNIGNDDASLSTPDERSYSKNIDNDDGSLGAALVEISLEGQEEKEKHEVPKSVELDEENLKNGQDVNFGSFSKEKRLQTHNNSSGDQSSLCENELGATQEPNVLLHSKPNFDSSDSEAVYNTQKDVDNCSKDVSVVNKESDEEINDVISTKETLSKKSETAVHNMRCNLAIQETHSSSFGEVQELSIMDFPTAEIADKTASRSFTCKGKECTNTEQSHHLNALEAATKALLISKMNYNALIDAIVEHTHPNKVMHTELKPNELQKKLLGEFPNKMSPTTSKKSKDEIVLKSSLFEKTNSFDEIRKTGLNDVDIVEKSREISIQNENKGVMDANNQENQELDKVSEQNFEQTDLSKEHLFIETNDNGRCNMPNETDLTGENLQTEKTSEVHQKQKSMSTDLHALQESTFDKESNSNDSSPILHDEVQVQDHNNIIVNEMKSNKNDALTSIKKSPRRPKRRYNIRRDHLNKRQKLFHYQEEEIEDEGSGYDSDTPFQGFSPGAINYSYKYKSMLRNLDFSRSDNTGPFIIGDEVVVLKKPIVLVRDFIQDVAKYLESDPKSRVCFCNFINAEKDASKKLQELSLNAINISSEKSAQETVMSQQLSSTKMNVGSSNELKRNDTDIPSTSYPVSPFPEVSNNSVASQNTRNMPSKNTSRESNLSSSKEKRPSSSSKEKRPSSSKGRSLSSPNEKRHSSLELFIPDLIYTLQAYRQEEISAAKILKYVMQSQKEQEFNYGNECKNLNSSRWFNKFITEYKAHQDWKVHIKGKMEKEVQEMEKNKIQILDKLYTLLRPRLNANNNKKND